MSDFLPTLGLALVAYAKERFEPGHNDWIPTAWPRVAELLDDLSDGVVRRRTLDPSHQTGVGTGRLRDSIHSEPDGDQGVRLVIGGAEVDYAQRFAEGGTNTIPVRQRELRRWYHTPEGKRFIREHQLGWLFAKTSVTFTSPARPIVTPDGIAAVVTDEARDHFQGARLEVER